MHLRRAHSRPTGGARCAAHLDARLAPARVDLTDASPTKKNINSKRGGAQPSETGFAGLRPPPCSPGKPPRFWRGRSRG